MAIREIVTNIKQTGIDSNALWAYPVASELKKYSYKLVLEWAIECIQIYLSQFKPSNSIKLAKYVQQIIDLEVLLSPSQCDEMGEKVWNSPGRDDIQSAIAYLWWMISQFKLGEDCGVVETAMAIGLLLPDTSDDDLLNKYLEAAIDTLNKNKYFKPPSAENS